ncbi:MAG: isomerase/hydrolase [SAR324 cluster bacterium]|uniref:Isomerase/hydrolase n=1 Tax=SAR324 cluster bacterium TaxID=2024889 RepID=A0A2A4T7D5_9DELT|nr:MAG: isomerase/hydrolase [SAR324 cluster bacterium]
MKYQHSFYDQSACSLLPGKIVCVGRNYLDHIKELNNPVPSEPILFIKPSTSLQSISDEILVPDYSNNCHHEVELSVLIGQELCRATVEEVEPAIVGYGIALDLTLRDVQEKLKAQGKPWERAKAFDGSCPLSPFVSKEVFPDPQDIELELKVNGESRQQGNSQLMMTKVLDLIAHISQFFTLLPGDVVLTGTPAGVSRLQSGDQVELILGKKYQYQTVVK